MARIHWLAAAVLAAAASSLHSQVVHAIPGAGGVRSISAIGSARTIAVNSTSGFLIGEAVSKFFDAPEGITLTSAVALNENEAVLAGTVLAGGDVDVWVGKVAVPSGEILNAMRMGGRGADTPRRVVVDAIGAVYVLISTTSPDFPVTQGRWRGAQDGVLVKLNAAGLETVFSTYLGGALHDDFQDLAVDPSGSSYVVAASNSAELASGPHGAPWFGSVSSGEPFVEGATGGMFRSTVQVWHTPNANVVYAGTAGQGVFRSSDSGQTWEPLNQGLGDLNITALSGDAQTVYAGSSRGLYRSTNGGTSWSELTLGSGASGIAAVATSPRDRNVVYIATHGSCGVFRSADGGRTWASGLPGVCVSALLATADAGFAFSASGVHKLQATGAWQQVSEMGGITGVAVDGDSWFAVVEGRGAYRSSDSGATWEEVLTGKVTCVAASGMGVVRIGTADQGIWDAAGNRIDDASILQPVRSIALSGTYTFAGTDYLPDVYVAKVSPRGDQVVFSAFVGGSGVESSPRLTVDGSANVLLAAGTQSVDLTASLEAVQRRPAGGTDVLLVRLNSTFATTAVSYFGGAGEDVPGAIAVDSRGFVHVTGSTASADFPVTPDASRKINGDSRDAFLAVLGPGFSTLPHATYFGGDAEADRGWALSVEPGGSAVWIAGAQGAEEGFAARFSGLVNYGAISSVRNAASLAAGPVAPSSTVIIEGSGFGESLSGLSVRIADIDAPVVRATGTQIEVMTPDGLESGQAAPVVVSSRTGLFQGSVAVDRVAPGVFSANRDGQGVALAALMRIDSESITTITPVYDCVDGPGTCSAVPIELGDEADQLYLLLRATGLRYRRSVSDVQVTVGGKEAEVISADALDWITGTDQILIRLPSGLGEAGVVKQLTIQVTVEGKAANTVTISLVG